MREVFVLNLTNSFKDIIRQNGLIDTGTLLASIRCFVTVSNGVMTIDLYAIDYMKYLVEPFRLIEQWTASPRFNQVVNDITEGLIEQEAEKLLQGGSYDASNIPEEVEIEIRYVK